MNKFTQINDSVLQQHARMVKPNPAAAAIILYLVSQMGSTDNCLICSIKVLEDATGFGKRAIINGIQYLESINWLKVYKSGKSNVYCINAEVAWKRHQYKNYEAKFRAKVILDSSEQKTDITKTKTLVDLSDLQIAYGNDVPY